MDVFLRDKVFILTLKGSFCNFLAKKLLTPPGSCLNKWAVLWFEFGYSILTGSRFVIMLPSEWRFGGVSNLHYLNCIRLERKEGFSL